MNLFKNCICSFKLFLLFAFMLGSQILLSQPQKEYPLSEAEFVSIITKFHPVIKQSEVAIQIAKSNLLTTRGLFDPSFNYSMDQKTFDGKNYYHYLNPELKIPTWYGIEINAGMEDNVGNNTNPEITKGVSSYLGIKIPLAKNLLIDNRRAALQQAKIYVTLSKVEQNILINNLFQEALNSYWKWVGAYNQLQILNQIIAVNEQRLQNVKLIYEQGSIAAIDTIEVVSQLQNFILQKNDIEILLVKSLYDIANYLWLNNNTQFNLINNLIPSEGLTDLVKKKTDIPPLIDFVNTTLNSHPKLEAFNLKLQTLDINKRLSFQSILPTFDVKANILNQGYYAWKGLSSSLIENNYKFGIDIKIPLRLSEGRGKYKAAQFKIKDTELELQQTILELENKVKSSYASTILYKKQIEIAQQNIENYKKLFKAEEVKFTIGESNLFFLNIRENKFLESQIKLIEIQTKYLTAFANLIWATGQLK